MRNRSRAWVPALAMLIATGTGWAENAVKSGSSVSVSGSGVAVASSSIRIATGNAVVGKGPVLSEDRQVPAYGAAVIEGAVDLEYTVAPARSLKVVAQANIVPLVTTEVKGGRLAIGLKGAVTTEHPIKVVATGPSLEALEISGSGDIKATGLAGRQAKLRIGGSGSITADGQVEVLRADVSGSGDIRAGGLRAADAEIVLSGSGDIDAHASKSVRVKLSGAGDISIAGKPAKRSVDKSGAGDVEFK